MMIPIDFQVFKALSARLESESDSYNQVLRRALELPPRGHAKASKRLSTRQT